MDREKIYAVASSWLAKEASYLDMVCAENYVFCKLENFMDRKYVVHPNVYNCVVTLYLRLITPW